MAYCVKITDIDPIRYQLLFERFLNPERVSMPAIDVDFCYERRQEVIDYVVEKYGKDQVAQIVTFGTLAARGVIRDVGRVMDLPYSPVSYTHLDVYKRQYLGEGNYITYGNAEVAEEVRAVQDAGYEEWMLWSAVNKYHLEGLSGDGSSAAAAEVLGEGEASSDGGETSAETEPETAKQRCV